MPILEPLEVKEKTEKIINELQMDIATLTNACSLMNNNNMQLSELKSMILRSNISLQYLTTIIHDFFTYGSHFLSAFDKQFPKNKSKKID
jgi:hypothetical protein